MKYPLLACLLFAIVACGGSDLKGEGEECVASSECADGLTCDFGATPAICKPMQTPVPDAAVRPIDAAGPVIDADPLAPDATPGTPDATPLPIDATPLPPDAGPLDGATIDV